MNYGCAFVSRSRRRSAPNKDRDIGDGLNTISEPWHLYWVRISRTEVEKLQEKLEHGWYAHFWNDTEILVVYNNAIFEMDRWDSSTWGAAIKHGQRMNIPREQLDFPTDESAGFLG